MSPHPSHPGGRDASAPAAAGPDDDQDAPSLSLIEDTSDQYASLPADALALVVTFRHHALRTPTGVPTTIPTSRALRRDYLPSWTRARYAAAMRALVNSGHYAATRQDGIWRVRVIVPRAV